MLLLRLVLNLLTFVIGFSHAAAVSAPSNNAVHSFPQITRRQDSSPATSKLLTVDLGYSIYQGTYNSSTDLNIWKGIRFAADVSGPNRWQAPKIPSTDRSTIKLAGQSGPQCPQAQRAGLNQTVTNVPVSEDCLFLNVYAPRNAKNLPVLFWIHGGGYSRGNGRQDMSTLINVNENSFIGVSIQYRLGAFGFLSSEGVNRNGVLNAGMLDQIFALKWVQANIRKFGGDPSRVTISGQSSGGGSVMLLSLVYEGALKTQFFTNLIAAAPYFPTQHFYNSADATNKYEAFARRAGCLANSSSSGNDSSSSSGEVFTCLTSKPSSILQEANINVTSSGLYGQWAFVPVTDGDLLVDQPGRQLLDRDKLNGQILLTGNNANEALTFVPPNITTEAEVSMFLKRQYPNLSAKDIETLLTTYYPSPNVTDNPALPRFATNGINPPTAINQSNIATGNQQRAYNIFAEATFICPSYWLALAYSSSSSNRHSTHPSFSASANTKEDNKEKGKGKTKSRGYKYQYSLLNSTHGTDVLGYFWPPRSTESPDLPLPFSTAIKTIWGNFIRTGNPSVSSRIANGQDTVMKNDAEMWPEFLEDRGGDHWSQWGEHENKGVRGKWRMMNLNATELGMGERNVIELVDAFEWEGGRGRRCEVWRNLTVRAADEEEAGLKRK